VCTRVRVWIRACNVHRKNVGVHICRYRCRCRRSVITDESLNMQRHPRARDLSRNSFLTDLWNAPVRASVKEHCKFVCTHTCVCGIELAEKDPCFVCTSISFLSYSLMRNNTFIDTIFDEVNRSSKTFAVFLAFATWFENRIICH